jgi:acyl-CoA:acyl-CoA alkyltransferase
MAIKISAVEHYIPTTLKSNQVLEDSIQQCNPQIKFIPGLIEKITGLKTRYWASEKEYSSTMSIFAAEKLFTKNNLNRDEIDLLIFASATKDLIEPATSHIIQAKLGTNAACFDIKNACNSFLNGIEVASALIISGGYKKALVVVGEKPSVSCKLKVKDKDDLKKSFAGYTFGDSGAAILLEKTENQNEGIHFQKFISMSKHWSVGTLPGGGTRYPRGDEYTYFHGGGSELKEAFVELGPDFLHKCLEDSGTEICDLKRVFIHQVSMPFLAEFLKATGIPSEKVEITFPELGNLAAATLPVGLSIALNEKRVEKGDKVLLIGLAGGISLGVTILTL